MTVGGRLFYARAAATENVVCSVPVKARGMYYRDDLRVYPPRAYSIKMVHRIKAYNGRESMNFRKRAGNNKYAIIKRRR